MIGVIARPSMTTLDSVPYLVHSDYVNCVAEVSEMADFVIFDLAGDYKDFIGKPGIQ